MSYKNIIVETRGNVGLITLNRPEALNVSSSPLMTEPTAHSMTSSRRMLARWCYGSEKALQLARYQGDAGKTRGCHHEDFITSGWERLTRTRKPVIAAVAGFALGGGCEVAMMCDFILAADNAKFGQPEVNLGIPPGAGGTQRLTRFVGKSKAMEMCLTGRFMDADEAERSGLASRIVPADKLIDEAVTTAQAIADKSLYANMIIKESVNRAYETTLSEGVRFERRMFHTSFGTDQQKEGMAAFVAKRKPEFKNG